MPACHCQQHVSVSRPQATRHHPWPATAHYRRVPYYVVGNLLRRRSQALDLLDLDAVIRRFVAKTWGCHRVVSCSKPPSQQCYSLGGCPLGGLSSGSLSFEVLNALPQDDDALGPWHVQRQAATHLTHRTRRPINKQVAHQQGAKCLGPASARKQLIFGIACTSPARLDTRRQPCAGPGSAGANNLPNRASAPSFAPMRGPRRRHDCLDAVQSPRLNPGLDRPTRVCRQHRIC